MPSPFSAFFSVVNSLIKFKSNCSKLDCLDCFSPRSYFNKKIPFISVLTDPTTGGVSASYASVGDVNLAEPGALIGFAGRRVIEQTIKQKLPDYFQSSEFFLEHGFIDCLVPRKAMKETLHKIISYYNR